MSAAELVVDVLIPAYGDSPLLREAVASVLAQDDPRWTLTLVDDGPVDADLAAWCLGLGSAVRYLHNPRNLGINRNFQRCVDLSTGDLVVLLGADDRMLSGYVAAVIAAADHFRGVAMVQPGVRVIDGQGQPVRPLGDRVKSLLAMRVHGSRLVGGEELAASLLRGNWMYFPAVAFRRDWLKRHGFRPGYDVVQDLDLYLRLLLDGARVVLLEEVCFEYRRHDASLSSTRAHTGERFDEELSFFHEVHTRMADRGWRRAARAADLHLASRLHSASRAAAAARSGDGRGTRRFVAQALVRPAGPKPGEVG
jgi:GT2 family glycosyltransferase